MSKTNPKDYIPQDPEITEEFGDLRDLEEEPPYSRQILHRYYEDLTEDEKYEVATSTYGILVDTTCPVESNAFYNCLADNDISLMNPEDEVTDLVTKKCSKQVLNLENCSLQESVSARIFGMLLSNAEIHCNTQFEKFQTCMNKRGADCDEEIKETMTCGSFFILKDLNRAYGNPKNIRDFRETEIHDSFRDMKEIDPEGRDNYI